MDAHTPDTRRGPVVYLTGADLRDLRRVAVEGAAIGLAIYAVLATVAILILIRGG